MKNYTCVRQYCDFDTVDKCIQCIRGYSYSITLRACVPANCQKYIPGYSGC